MNATPARQEAPLAGQVALVTGGSSGLGRAIAQGLAAAGCTVVVAGRSLNRCEQAAAELAAATGSSVGGRACGVTDGDALHALVGQIADAHGRLDVLVTSAGVQARGELAELDAATLRRCLDVIAPRAELLPRQSPARRGGQEGVPVVHRGSDGPPGARSPGAVWRSSSGTGSGAARTALPRRAVEAELTHDYSSGMNRLTGLSLA